MAANTGLFGMGVFGTVAAAVAGIVAAGYVARETVFRPQDTQISIEAPENADASTGTSAGTDAPSQPPEAQVAAVQPDADKPQLKTRAAVIPPAFDIVRVDADGTAVIAGTAMPGSTVRLYVDGAEWESTGAGPEGKFAMFSFIAPKEQPQLLTLLASLNGQEVWADDQIILAPLPEPQAPSEDIAAADPDPAPETVVEDKADVVQERVAEGDVDETVEPASDETVASADPPTASAEDAADEPAAPAPEPPVEVAEAPPVVAEPDQTETPDPVAEADVVAESAAEPAAVSSTEPTAEPSEDVVASLAEPETTPPVEADQPDIAEAEAAPEPTPSAEPAAPAPETLAEADPSEAETDRISVPETETVAEADPLPEAEPEVTAAADPAPISEPVVQTPPVTDTMARAPSDLTATPDPSAVPPQVAETTAPDIVTAMPVSPAPGGPVSPPGPDLIPAPLPERAVEPVAEAAPIDAQPPEPPAPEADAPEVVADLPDGPVAEAPVAPPGPEVVPAPRPQNNAAPVVPGAPDAPETPGEEPRDFAAAPATQPSPGGVAVIRAGSEGVELIQPANPQRPEALDRLALDTISYSEAGDVQLSGRAPEGAAVRVYLNNRAVADLPIDAEGRWKGELGDVRPGVYTLRLDQVAADGRVGGRLETPFKREAPAVLKAARADLPPDAPSVALVTVQRGDTLWAISRENYGSGFMYVRVFEANRDSIRNPDLIYPGQIFTIPN